MIRRLMQSIFFIYLLLVFALLMGEVDNRGLFLTSSPTSVNQGQHGLWRLRSLIQTAGGQTQRIDLDYHSLNAPADIASAENNLLFLSLPAAIPADKQELASLSSWVARGNDIVVMLALDDTPHWSNKQTRHSLDDFMNAFNLKLTRLEPGQEVTPDVMAPGFLISRLNHPVTRNIKRVQTGGFIPDHVWQLRGGSTSHSALILLREEKSLSPVAWLTHFGKGNLYIFTLSDIFANANILNADNMFLAKNILDYSLGKSAVVYFDDVHHIVTDNIDNEFHPPYPLLMLLAGLFAYGLLVYLYNQLSQPRRQIKAGLTSFVSKNARQLTRNLSKSEAALCYAGFFFDDIRQRLDLPVNQQPVWEDLRQQRVNQRILRKAQKTHQLALVAKRFNLSKFIRRLEKLRNQLK